MRSLVFFLTLVTCGPLLGDIVPSRGSQRIRPVFEESDVVCNGFVEALTVLGTREVEGSSQARRRVRANVTVRDFYKTPSPHLGSIVVEFEHYWPGGSAAEPMLRKAQTGLLFLKRGRAGVYEFADRFLGVTTFQSLPKQPGALGLQKLESALTGVAVHGDREERIRALELLHGFDTVLQPTASKLVSLSTSQDPEIAFWAIAVLLRTESFGALESLIRYLNSYKGDDEPIWAASINTDLAQVRDVRSLPILEGLSDSRYRPIRLGAVEALRAIKSRKSAPALVRRLDDADRTIQYIAVISLAEILGKYEGDYAPGMPAFEKDPRKYTDLWKKWWAQQGHAR